MKTQTAIRHFGNKTQLASAAGVSRQAVQQWGEFVPERIAYKLEKKTSGALKAMEQHYGEQQCKRRTIKSSRL